MENNFFKCESVVLQNIPSWFDLHSVKDYVEGTLDVDVVKVIILPFIKNRALVVIKQTLPDFDSAAKRIRDERLVESQEIILLQSCQMPAVIVTDIDFNLLEEEFLKMYLEVTFADCNDVITNCIPFPYINVAVLHLAHEHQEVVKRILAIEDHIPLPSENYHIKICPFFKNFHDQIENQNICQIQDRDINKHELKSDEAESFHEEKKGNSFENVISQNDNQNKQGDMIDKDKPTAHKDHALQSKKNIKIIEKQNITNNDGKNEQNRIDFINPKTVVRNKTDQEIDSNSCYDQEQLQDTSHVTGSIFTSKYSSCAKDVNVLNKNDLRIEVTNEEIDTNTIDEHAVTDEENNSSDEHVVTDEENNSSDEHAATDEENNSSDEHATTDEENNSSDEHATTDEENNSSDEHATTDEENNSSDEHAATDEENNSSHEHAATDEENNSSDEHAATDEENNSSDEHAATDEENNSSDEHAATSEENNSSDEHALTDEETHTNSRDEKRKKNVSNVRGISLRGRGSGRIKATNIQCKNVRDEITDEEETHTNSSEKQKKVKGTSNMRGTSFRGRGSIRTKAKNVPGKNGRDEVTVGETHTNLMGEQRKEKGTPNMRGSSIRGRGRTKAKIDEGKNNFRGEVTDEEIYSNSSDEQNKQCDFSSIRGAANYRGWGRGMPKVINAKGRQDVGDKIITTNIDSKNMIWNQNQSNYELIEDLKDKNPVSSLRGRGRNVSRGQNKNNQGKRLESSDYISDKIECSENTTKDLSKKLVELQRKKEEMEEENSRLAVDIYKIPMTELEAKCLQHYMKTYSECEVSYDSGVKTAILKSPHYKMQKCQSDILIELKKVKEIDIPLNKDVQNILSSDKGQIFLQSLNTSELKSACLELGSNSLKVAALEEIILNEAIKIIKEKVEYAETLEGKSDIPLDEINILKLKIENKFKAKVNWDAQKAQLAILGIKDDVLAARKEVEIFLEKYGVSEKSFDLGEPLTKYFFSFLEKDIKHILKSVKIGDFTFTECQITIRYQGNQVDTIQVHHKLEDLKKQLKVLKWNLLDDFKAHEIFLIISCFKYGNMKEIEAYTYKNKCFIDFSNLTSFQLILPEPRSDQHKKKFEKLKPQKALSQISMSEKSLSLNENVYTVTNTCQLVIKDGDIVLEKSDILVSVLGTDLNLKKTRVGGSFNKACRSHWREVKSSHENNPNSVVVTVKNPKDLSCQAVCHIILEPWDPNTSPGKLTLALQEVLNEAKLLGAKSISIPALGCGATFKFPPSNVAQIMFQVFLAINLGSFLQQVVLLAADSDLSKELNHQASKHFKCLKIPQKPAEVPSAMTGTLEESSDNNSDDSEDDFFKIDDPSTNKNQSSTELVIIAVNEKIESLKSEIKKVLTQHCLFTKYFNQDHMKYWPRDSKQKIVQRAKELSVWVARSKHPKTKNVGFLIKGEKSVVEKMLASLQQEYLEISKSLPQKRLSSNTAPKRGTLDFLQYASESDEKFPSYWSLNGSKSYWENIKSYWSVAQKRKHLIVDIDQETKDIIVKLVKITFDPQLVKNDKAAVGLTHSSIKIIDVQRVENVKLFEKYHDQRKTLFKKMLSMKRVCQDIGKIPDSKGRVVTAQYLSDAMKKELFYEVNEQYLFYGTEIFEPVINFGLDSRSSANDGLFGKGIYTTEMSSVADVYTDSMDNRSPKGTPMTLILARVLLGNVFLCDHKNKHVTGQGYKKLSRPPCMSCSEDRCSCPKQTLFDSVMGDGHWLYRHFVIYEGNQIYPEYIITYERK